MDRKKVVAGINKRPSKSNFKIALQNWPLYTMFIPGFILTFIFSYLPMFGMIIPFKKINLRDGIFSSPWVGFENFKLLFKSSNVWVAIRNTVLYNFIWIFLGLVIAVGLAIILSGLRNKFARKTYQTVLIMPHFLSMVIVAYLVMAFLNIENGFINNTILPWLQGKDADKINWYAKPEAWPLILTIVNIWKTAGYNSVVYIAAIAGIDVQMYEAAKIDGASKWQEIWYITIPSLKNMMIMMTILNIGKIFIGDFGLFYNVTMNSGALYPKTLILNTYVYNMMTQAGTAGIGLSAAAAFTQSIVGFVLVVVTNAIVNRLDSESALF